MHQRILTVQTKYSKLNDFGRLLNQYRVGFPGQQYAVFRVIKGPDTDGITFATVVAYRPAEEQVILTIGQKKGPAMHHGKSSLCMAGMSRLLTKL